jgi:thioredoxin reductase (NADPH)
VSRENDERELREAADPSPDSALVLVVNPDASVARAIAADLRRALDAAAFDCDAVDSPGEALEILTDLRERGRHAALLVVDDETSPMSGIELAGRARGVHPNVGTIALVPYPRRDDALRAMNAGTLHDFLVKPIAPSSEQLIPVASDYLDDWKRRREYAQQAVHLVADPDGTGVPELREFLARNDVQYVIVNPAGVEGREILAAGGLEPPVVVLADGTRLAAPTAFELAEGLGIPTRPKGESYDLIIVGGGPAGLAGAVYGASEGLETVLMERHAPGGQAGQSAKIENYLGFPSGLTGSDLTQRALKQARRFEAELIRPRQVIRLELDGSERIVHCADGARLRAPTVLIACGVAYRRLEAPGMEELVGRGVYYGAAASEVEWLADQEVVIVGGANSAGQAALHFAERARKVTILVRGEGLDQGMSHYLVERVTAAPNVDVLTETTVSAVSGDGALEAVEVSDRRSGEHRTLAASGLFIFIGAVPHTDWLAGVVGRDERGFLVTGREAAGREDCVAWLLDRDPYPLESSVPGVFVAGDVRRGSIKRVASAVGEGAMAVQLIHQYLAELSDTESGAQRSTRKSSRAGV